MNITKFPAAYRRDRYNIVLYFPCHSKKITDKYEYYYPFQYEAPSILVLSVYQEGVADYGSQNCSGIARHCEEMKHLCGSDL